MILELFVVSSVIIAEFFLSIGSKQKAPRPRSAGDTLSCELAGRCLDFFGLSEKNPALAPRFIWWDLADLLALRNSNRVLTFEVRAIYVNLVPFNIAIGRSTVRFQSKCLVLCWAILLLEPVFLSVRESPARKKNCEREVVILHARLFEDKHLRGKYPLQNSDLRFFLHDLKTVCCETVSLTSVVATQLPAALLFSAASLDQVTVQAVYPKSEGLLLRILISSLIWARETL